jgi:hypothetical protein
LKQVRKHFNFNDLALDHLQKKLVLLEAERSLPVVAGQKTMVNTRMRMRITATTNTTTTMAVASSDVTVITERPLSLRLGLQKLNCTGPALLSIPAQ